MQSDGIIFFTATCNGWKQLLREECRKKIILDSLKFLVCDNRIWLYGYVIMHNHIHLMWRKKESWIEKDIQQIFLKYTAQKLKFHILDTQPEELNLYRSNQRDRDYNFWKRGAYKSEMYTRRVAAQKITYIHNNPVKAGYCSDITDYAFSSARYYELNVDGYDFLTHYADHLA